jgi:hypothetical protein
MTTLPNIHTGGGLDMVDDMGRDDKKKGTRKKSEKDNRIRSGRG